MTLLFSGKTFIPYPLPYNSSCNSCWSNLICSKIQPHMLPALIQAVIYTSSSNKIAEKNCNLYQAGKAKHGSPVSLESFNKTRQVVKVNKHRQSLCHPPILHHPQRYCDIHPSVCFSIYPSAHPSACFSIHISAYLSICPSIDPSIQTNRLTCREKAYHQNIFPLPVFFFNFIIIYFISLLVCNLYYNFQCCYCCYFVSIQRAQSVSLSTIRQSIKSSIWNPPIQSTTSRSVVTAPGEPPTTTMEGTSHSVLNKFTAIIIYFHVSFDDYTQAMGTCGPAEMKRTVFVVDNFTFTFC